RWGRTLSETRRGGASAEADQVARAANGYCSSAGPIAGRVGGAAIGYSRGPKCASRASTPRRGQPRQSEAGNRGAGALGSFDRGRRRRSCRLVGGSARAIQLILMDVQMPTMDGLRATMEIRASEEHTGGHVPIIAMTAH